ncbi:MAG: hypothetical protein M5U08_14765 [Burkholderiales bacterium]|nr:hypothetical protein [Burkholderiales bacterium]
MIAQAHAGGTREHSMAGRALDLEANRLGLRLARVPGDAFDPQGLYSRPSGGRLAGRTANHPADAPYVEAMRAVARDRG